MYKRQALVALIVPGAAQTTPLDDYVYTPDPAYGYSLTGQEDEDGFTIYRLSMTSGTRRSPSEVDQTLWTHELVLYVPDVVVRDTAILLIEGGSAGSSFSDPLIEDAVGLIAGGTGAVLAYLGQVPYQPLQFTGTPGKKSEDALIAHSWMEFLQDTSDVTWPAQLPMARAGVRAMDAVQDFMADLQPAAPIVDFAVMGASKRGWTTWLVAAAESGPLGAGRVAAIVPIVIDVPNMEPSFKHHLDVYGFWAPAIHDYVDAGVMDHVDTPEIAALFAIVDPHVYRDRLTMPKYVFNSAGDQFFLPDSSAFYYDDFPGEKRLRYFPNTDHTLVQVELTVVVEALALFGAILDDSLAVPDYTWAILPDGTITLQTSEPDVEVKLWQATNPAARDFRFEIIGPAYTDTVLADQGGGFYSASVAPPPQGFTAYLLEARFGGQVAFTSGVNVVGATLASDVSSVSVAAGGSQALSLFAGLVNRGRPYFLLGSAGGTAPGIALDGQLLPLNPGDAYFNFTLAVPNSGLLSPSFAALDSEGRAEAGFTLPPGAAAPGLVGLELNHAFLVLDDLPQVVFTSDAEPLTLGS